LLQYKPHTNVQCAWGWIDSLQRNECEMIIFTSCLIPFHDTPGIQKKVETESYFKLAFLQP
jgi:hypothetical protein